MRLPQHHRFTHHLIHKFGLKTSLFVNKHADNHYYFRGRKVLELVNFETGIPRTVSKCSSCFWENLWKYGFVFPIIFSSYFFQILCQFLQSAVDAGVMKSFQKEFGLSDEEAETDPVDLYLKVCTVEYLEIDFYHL